jgi:integrase/recombinase XerD
LLREYIGYKPKFELFEGSMLENLIQKKKKKGFTKCPQTSTPKVNNYKTRKFGCVMATTHLLEKVVPICATFKIVGHNSSKTTEILHNVGTKSLQQIKVRLMICKINILYLKLNKT